ncbi:hypothetical protein ACHAQA_002691 [Verticillium albo-atrum]
MEDIRKVIIIGGGPAGLLAALRLRQSNGIAPVIYEIRRSPTTLGGALGIPANGLRLLHRMGLYSEMAAKGAFTSSLVLHALNGCIMGEMDMAAWSTQQTGFGYLRIQRSEIVDVLLQSVKKEEIPIHYGKALTGIEEKDNQVTVRFADGTSDTGDFLLGCDGIHSAVRNLYVDPGTTPEYTGIANMFSLVPTDNLTPTPEPLTNLNATITPNGLFAVSPTTPTNNLLYWFFSREVPLPASGDARDGWEAQGKKEEESFKTTLLSLLGSEPSDWTGMLRQLVHQTETIRFYPIHKLPAGRPWYRGRCLVLGDAAHAMPPHASQGVSMALEDVFLFTKMLASRPATLEAGLTSFVAKRRIRTDAMLKKAEQNGAVRKQTAPWRVRANELAISGGLWVYKTAGLERFGLGQKPLAYDVEEEVFDV